MPSPFIPDGFTNTANIESPDGRWDAFQIEYRPAVSAETRRATASGTPDQEEQRETAFLKNKLVSWSLTDGTGSAIPINEQNIGRLTFSAKQAMIAVICGFTANNQPKPDAEQGKN